MAPRRLAITISGAVSLGSYEAGVLYEVLSALGQHNRDPATGAEERIVIDVLTGASAGGMTATIAAQKLLFEAAALEGPYANALYRPWVVDATIEGLLALHGGDDPLMSILSSQLIADISERYLTQRYAGAASPAARHAAAAERLWLGLALANLNGVDYGLPVRPSGAFVYTRYQDELTVALGAADDTRDTWEPLRQAAVACGAFPFAFRVVDVLRHAVDYAARQPLSPVAAAQSFAYTDGGTFNNEPLGLAKNLVDEIDDHRDGDSRLYLYVSPRALTGSASTRLTAANASFLPFAKQLLAAIFDQAQFQDWVTAEQVNRQIALFDRQAVALKDLIVAQPAAEPALRGALKFLLAPLLANRKTSRTPPRAARLRDLETLELARHRLRGQFAVEVVELDRLAARGSVPASTPATWIDAILAFETAADLASRDEMAIYAITDDQTKLASNELFAFAGFFDQRYRDHDYDRGRARAQDFLRSGAWGTLRFTPEAIERLDSSLEGLTLEKMDAKLREEVRDRLRDRAHVVLKALGVDEVLIGGALREAIDLALIKPALNKILKL